MTDAVNSTAGAVGPPARHPWADPLSGVVAAGAILVPMALLGFSKPLLPTSSAYLGAIAIVALLSLVADVRFAVLAMVLSGSGVALFIEDGTPAIRLAHAVGFVGAGSLVLYLRHRLNRSHVRAEVLSDDYRAMSDELAMLVDNLDAHAVILLDADRRVVIWNSGAERVLRWRTPLAIGRTLDELFPPLTDDQSFDAECAAAEREGRSETERRLRRPDGRVVPTHRTVTALSAPNNDVRGFGVVIHDLSRFVAAQDEVRYREDHLASILATVPDAMLVTDGSGRVISFSPAAEHLFGYDEADLLGRDVRILTAQPHRQRQDGFLRSFEETGMRRAVGAGRFVIGRRQDGSTFPLQLSVGEAGTEEAPIYTAFIRDLTEAHAAEATLKALQEDLIHVARLSAMGTMASTLAHELNQPLTAVANYLEAGRDLLTGSDDRSLELAREAVEEAAGEALRAGEIVRRLRQFTSRGEVEHRAAGIAGILTDAVTLATVGINADEVTVRSDVAADAGLVLVDPVQIQQVVVNLVRNALEALRGQADARVRVLAAPRDDETIEVAVIDNGPGLPAEVSGRAFSAFVSTKDGGMGLGLSICRTIVEANGGRIWADNNGGSGTAFRFTLPRMKEAADE